MYPVNQNNPPPTSALIIHIIREPKSNGSSLEARLIKRTPKKTV
jgi:hypothetical protein